MRIRKRKVPLPLSLLSPIPLSDPHLFSRSPVQPDDNFTTPTCSDDHFSTPTCCSDTDLALANTNTTHVSLPVTGVEGIQMSNDDSSNASITTTTTTCAPSDDNDNNNHNNGPPSLLSNNEGLVGRWCDGDRAIPLKKRRTMVVKCDVENDKEKQMLKSSVTTSDEARIINNNGDNSNNQVSGKKSNGSKRGNTIMEGSRCSRVNGRGWRCCQQTLVGYSLCEHHLGKGRLRSMTSSSTSAKSRSSKNKKNASTNTATYPFNTTGFPLGSHDQEKEKLGDGNNNVEKKMERMSSFGTSSTTTSSNKRVKLGVVKARSLSSLLGQTNTMSNIVGDHHANMHQQEKISN